MHSAVIMVAMEARNNPLPAAVQTPCARLDARANLRYLRAKYE